MRILFVDDDPINLAELEDDYLIDVAYDSSEASYLAQVNDYDIVMVDSFELCSDLRSKDSLTPIFFVDTSIDTEKVTKALYKGADYCLQKPINREELKAKVTSIKRRELNLPDNVITFSDFTLDLQKRVIYFKDILVPFKRKEYEILEYLVCNANKIISKEILLEKIWRDGMFVMSNTIEVHIRHIRIKLFKYVPDKVFIKTYYHKGYMFIHD